MVSKMPQKATAVRNVLLVLFLLCAVVNAQTASLAFGHLHQHSSDQHCCGLCHSGPLPLIQSSMAAAFAPSLTVMWMEASGCSTAPYQVLLTAADSRAPPA